MPNPKIKQARVGGVTYDLEDADAQRRINYSSDTLLCLASALNVQHVHFDPASDSFMDLFKFEYRYLRADGSIIDSSSSPNVHVYITQKLVAVPGDTISITLSEASTTPARAVFVVYDMDGNVTHVKAAEGATTYVSDTYTFSKDDAYFRLCGRYNASVSNYSVSYTPSVLAGTSLYIESPSNVRAEVNTSVNLSVSVYPVYAAVSYQWQYTRLNQEDTWHNTGMPGNQTNTVTIDVTSARYNYAWRCVVTWYGVEYYSGTAQILPPETSGGGD